MVPEYGHLALIIAFMLSVLLTVVPLVGTFTGRLLWINSARPLAIGMFIFTLVSFLVLVYAFLQDDFTVKYVAGHSNTLLPVFYKVTAVWGGHEGSVLLWALVLSLSAWEFARGMAPGAGWRLALPALPWLGLLALGQYRWRWLRWPLGAAFDPLRQAFVASCMALVGVGWLRALRHAGDSAPLPWIALLNPLDLVQLAALGLFARWLWSTRAPAVSQRRVALLSSAGFLLLTCITLRAVHHWGGVQWGGALWSASLAQTALTVVWSVLGVAGWIGGSRRGQRALWLAGAVLMAVVLAKLVLVDRQHLGDPRRPGGVVPDGLRREPVGQFGHRDR